MFVTGTTHESSNYLENSDATTFNMNIKLCTQKIIFVQALENESIN